MLIRIDHTPIPLQRPRSGKHGFYDPQYQAKQNFAFEVKKYFTQETIYKPIRLSMEFHIPFPKSWSKKKKNKMYLYYHVQKPDLSNFIKFVEDALNTIIWHDDSLIIEIHAFKLWDYSGFTLINFEVVDD